MAEIPSPIKKPLVKRVSEDYASESKLEEEEDVIEAPVVKPALEVPKLYRCMTRCWAKKQIFEPGDVATFEPGEFVPAHFKEIG